MSFLSKFGAQKSDPRDAVKQLHLEYSRFMYKFLMKKHAKPEIAEEIIQEVFMNLYENFYSIKEVAKMFNSKIKLLKIYCYVFYFYK